jgi:hypothetical protein
MKALVLVLFSLTLSTAVFAGGDPLEVKLKIVDSVSGEALIGAHVRISGTDDLLYSDPEGIILLDPSLIDANADLNIEYISYVDASVKMSIKPGMTILAMNPR